MLRRVCVDPFGCGMQLNYAVGATVTGLSADSPTAGGLMGGSAVTILGSGFDPDPNLVSVRFGATPCAVLSSNSTAVTCRIATPSPLLSSTSAPQALSLRSGLNASEVQYAGVTFTFDQALGGGATVTAVAPLGVLCSAGGGALVTITGTGFSSSPPSLQVGRGDLGTVGSGAEAGMLPCAEQIGFR